MNRFLKKRWDTVSVAGGGIGSRLGGLGCNRGEGTRDALRVGGGWMGASGVGLGIEKGRYREGVEVLEVMARVAVRSGEVNLVEVNGGHHMALGFHSADCNKALAEE